METRATASSESSLRRSALSPEPCSRSLSFSRVSLIPSGPESIWLIVIHVSEKRVIAGHQSQSLSFSRVSFMPLGPDSDWLILVYVLENCLFAGPWSWSRSFFHISLVPSGLDGGCLIPAYALENRALNANCWFLDLTAACLQQCYHSLHAALFVHLQGPRQ